jgi:hypothetical protein
MTDITAGQTERNRYLERLGDSYHELETDISDLVRITKIVRLTASHDASATGHAEILVLDAIDWLEDKAKALLAKYLALAEAAKEK